MKLEIKPHRKKVLANQPGQKVFVLVSFRPEAGDAQKEVPTSLVFVVDVSGSMAMAYGAGNETKLELVSRSLQKMADEAPFSSEDRVGLVCFDTEANVLFPLQPFSSSELKNAANGLQPGGGTSMDQGISRAIGELDVRGGAGKKTLFLFTDGETMNEEECLMLAQECKRKAIKIDAFGVGDEYNEDLLQQVSEGATFGKERHIEDLSDFSRILAEEFATSKKEIITQASLEFHLSREVKIQRAWKITPHFQVLEFAHQRVEMGNIPFHTESVFLLEVDAPQRKPTRVRLGQAVLRYREEDQDISQEHNLVIEYTENDEAARALDPEVMHYVGQKGLSEKISSATVFLKQGDMEKATQVLDEARNTAVLCGNEDLGNLISQALEEMNQSGTISEETRKTILVEGRGKTKPFKGVIDNDAIRKSSGT